MKKDRLRPVFCLAVELGAVEMLRAAHGRHQIMFSFLRGEGWGASHGHPAALRAGGQQLASESSQRIWPTTGVLNNFQLKKIGGDGRKICPSPPTGSRGYTYFLFFSRCSYRSSSHLTTASCQFPFSSIRTIMIFLWPSSSGSSAKPPIPIFGLCFGIRQPAGPNWQPSLAVPAHPAGPNFAWLTVPPLSGLSRN